MQRFTVHNQISHGWLEGDQTDYDLHEHTTPTTLIGAAQRTPIHLAITKKSIVVDVKYCIIAMLFEWYLTIPPLFLPYPTMLASQESDLSQVVSAMSISKSHSRPQPQSVTAKSFFPILPCWQVKKSDLSFSEQPLSQSHPQARPQPVTAEAKGKSKNDESIDQSVDQLGYLRRKPFYSFGKCMSVKSLNDSQLIISPLLHEDQRSGRFVNFRSDFHHLQPFPFQSSLATA